jgi:hypothetical protein
MIKMFMTPFELPIKSIPFPKEVECLGIRFSDLDLRFRKGFMEVSIDYQPVDAMDGEACDKFMEALRNGPKQIMDSAEDLMGGKSLPEFMQTM